jgi:hypothetical protein
MIAPLYHLTYITRKNPELGKIYPTAWRLMILALLLFVGFSL